MDEARWKAVADLHRLDPESHAATEYLHRLACVRALNRVLRESGVDECRRRLQKVGEVWGIEPDEEDYEAVCRDHPDVLALASRSNPFLSGPN
jgi:hypothetical protein